MTRRIRAATRIAAIAVATTTGLLVGSAGVGRAADDARDARRETLEVPPTTGSPAASSVDPSSDPSGTSLPIDLATTLALAGAQSVEVELARARTAESRAVQEKTRSRFFPWIEPSVGYRRHEGRLQDVVGRIIDTEKQAYDVGAAVVLEVDLGKAAFEALAARQRVRASEHADRAQRRESIARAAARYVELERAEASVLIAQESVRIAQDYADQLERAVAIGIAFRGDAFRARARVERNRQLASRAAADRRIAAAHLAEILSLDPAIDLQGTSPELAIWDLVEPSATQDRLVRTALQRRPELRGSSATLRAAEADSDAVRIAPWLPTLGARAGVYGLGGGEGDAVGRFEDGQDYAVGLRWRIGPGGLLDVSRHHEAAARELQVSLERRRIVDLVKREVVEAHTRARALAEQLGMAERMLESAEETLRLCRDRRAFGVGSVLETLAAEEELTQARLDYVGLVAEANRAQLELQRAIGDDPENASGSDVIPRS